MADELVDIAVVVGQQDPGLHMAPVAAGVVHQAAQGEVHPRRIEQCQRQRINVSPVIQTIGDAISGGRQIGARENPCQRRCGNAGTRQLITLFDHIGIGDVLLTDADFDSDGKVAHQRLKLLQQIATESAGMGDGDTVGARQLNLGVGAGNRRHLTMVLIGQTQFRVTKQRALFASGFGAVLEVALERQAQGRSGLLVQAGQTIDSLLGGFYDNEGFISTAHNVLPV
ncbi:hypothetical protein D3C79_721670 [compost metagenome]